MNNLPLISIIVPTFNYGHLIIDTLEDLKKQTYQNWECLIIDDGSSDDTTNTVSKFIEGDKRFKYFYQQNQGLSGARNTGLKNAKGEFIQLLDSDDKLEKDKLKIQAEELISNPKTDIVYGGVRYFTTENPSLRLYDMKTVINRTWMPCVSGTGLELMKYMVKGNIMVVNAPLFRKSIVNTVGFFDVGLKALEDWDYWVRCAINGFKFSFLDRPGTLALVRSHYTSMTKNNLLMYQANIKFRLKLKEYLQSVTEIDCRKMIDFNNRELHKLYSETACETIRNGNLKVGWKEIYQMGSKSEYPFVYFSMGVRYTRKYFKKKVISLFK